jgi:hypothetical protein
LSEIKEEIRRRRRVGSNTRGESASAGELHCDGIDNDITDVHYGKD